MFCQSCGQKNIDEARFCNFCGERIAAPGTPGGRVDLEPARPESRSEGWGPSMTLGDSLALSLAGIGIKTPGRAYGFVVGVALALMTVGGVLAYFLMRDDAPPVVEAGHASPGDAFLVGAPIPEGLELPPFPGETPSEPEPRPRAPSEPPRTITSNAPAYTPPPKSPPAPSTPPAPPPAPAPAAPAPAPAEPPKPPEAPTPPPAEPTTPKDPEAEMELELYAGRVRFAVSRYYAGATRSCFEQATQSNATLSGTVVVATKVGADGQVKSASLARNSTGDQTLGECLVGQVRSFRLPPPPSGEIELKLPFSR